MFSRWAFLIFLAIEINFQIYWKKNVCLINPKLRDPTWFPIVQCIYLPHVTAWLPIVKCLLLPTTSQGEGAGSVGAISEDQLSWATINQFWLSQWEPESITSTSGFYLNCVQCQKSDAYLKSYSILFYLILSYSVLFYLNEE